ncbi:hypothetical protein OK016_29040 [Vibrio chagasii]|nr:hypothetical protein [Vibrio chagasii]
MDAVKVLEQPFTYGRCLKRALRSRQLLHFIRERGDVNGSGIARPRTYSSGR